jgi:hypothetical protein
MHLKLYGTFGDYVGYTFAIENPKGSHFFRTDEAKQLMQLNPDMPEWKPAVECEFHACLFNGGEYNKATVVLTNNPAVVHFLGCKDKTHWPDAPDPQFLCGADVEPAGLSLLGALGINGQKRHCCQFSHNHPVLCQDRPARDGQPYPVMFCSMIMFHVNAWFRSPGVGMGNRKLFG